MTTVDHLTALDATFLELEDADESAHMHIGAVMVFDPTPEHGPPPLNAVREHLETRLGLLPRYRERLSEIHPGGFGWPAWEPDDAFDISAHVRHAALPAPGGEAELLAWASDFWSHRLDRGRPLWELVLLEGLAEGRWALCSKVHHCMVDGVGSVDVSYLMLDASPEPSNEPLAPPLPHERARDHAAGPLRLPTVAIQAGLSAVRAGVDTALHPGQLVDALKRSRAALELLARDEIVPAPSSSLNVRTGTRRRFEAVHASLDELKGIKNALGGTVNDVVLAAVTGGLHRLIEARAETPPARGLRAMVPVNLRQEAEHGKLGNRISSLFVHLPVAEREPMQRYRRAMQEAEGLKSGNQALGSEALLDVTALAPPVLHSFLARSLFASRLFNITVTNVPGPQVPLYAFGAKMCDVFPLVPIAAEHALGIAVVSYDGNVTFGLNADFDALPDLELVREGIRAEIDALAALAARTGARPPS